MTDNEIVKAWEKYVYPTDSIGQKLYPVVVKCPRELAEHTLDLILRLQDQNAALISGQETLQKCIAEKDAEIERYKGVIKLLEKDVKTAKSEAIKEFAERICKDRVSNDPVVIAVKAELKMVGTDD